MEATPSSTYFQHLYQKWQTKQELDGVQSGGETMNVFDSLYKLEEGEKEKMKKTLLVYCKLDTLAMVKVLEKLRN